MIDRSATLQRSDNHVTAPLEETLVMMDIDSGTYYMLDEVAAFLWERLAEPTPVAGLVASLCDRYDVSSERCEADVLPFLSRLHEKGLVEISGGS